MKYVVDLNGIRTEVDVSGESVGIDGVAEMAHVEDLPGTPIRLVRIGTRVHRVVVRRGAGRGQYTLSLDGWRFEGEAIDERTRAIRDIAAASAKPAGPAPVIAPMPGMIVRVGVSVGDTVHAGQGVVAMEAMKMENELRAQSGGVVKAVHVAAGQAVEKGMVLVEMEAAE